MLKIVSFILSVVVISVFLVESPADKVVFLDVGQGDAILLQNGTQQVLVDGGPGMSVLAKLGEEMPWWDKRIEVVILTHPQRDHMEGLLHVLERYEVGMVLLPWATNKSQMQERWIELIGERGVPHRFAWRGQSLDVGDISFDILGPFDGAEAARATRSDVNNASIIARVDFCPEVGSCLSLLLTGDAEKRVEKMLVNNTPSDVLDVDIIKVGHHGSGSSTTADLLAASSPASAIISVGEANRFGHPSAEVMERLNATPIYRTDQHGSVRITWAGGGWLLSCGKTCITQQ